MVKRIAKVDLAKVDRNKLMDILRARTSRLVSVREVVPNPYNKNKMGNAYFSALKANMADPKVGFTIPILVRPNPERASDPQAAPYMIVDGEHRWRAASELGYDEIPVVNLGEMSEDLAKYLMLESNQVKGATSDEDLKTLTAEIMSSEEFSDFDAWANLILEEPADDAGKYKLDDEELETEGTLKHPISLYLDEEQVGTFRRITGQLRLSHGCPLEEAVMICIEHFERSTGFGEKTGDEALDRRQSDLLPED